MNKNIIIIVLAVVGGLFLLNVVGKNRQPDSSSQVQAQPQTNQGTSSDNVSLVPADSVEVVNFFGTQRCASCIAVGTLTKKTLEERFSEELESGKVVFREVNGELPENRELVIKYQARGSSLFINAIRGEQDDIAEDVTVWRLINDEDQFVSYLENKLNKLLGKI